MGLFPSVEDRQFYDIICRLRPLALFLLLILSLFPDFTIFLLLFRPTLLFFLRFTLLLFINEPVLMKTLLFDLMCMSSDISLHPLYARQLILKFVLSILDDLFCTIDNFPEKVFKLIIDSVAHATLLGTCFIVHFELETLHDRHKGVKFLLNLISHGAIFNLSGLYGNLFSLLLFHKFTLFQDFIHVLWVELKHGIHRQARILKQRFIIPVKGRVFSSLWLELTESKRGIQGGIRRLKHLKILL
jgi:hypothetical protein